MDVQYCYCTACGSKNPVDSNFCGNCGKELIPPHPIQLEGGQIFSLVCENCDSWIMVTETQGTVTCEECGTSYTIEQGEGYLTIRPIEEAVTEDESAEEISEAEEEDISEESEALSFHKEIFPTVWRNERDCKIKKLENEVNRRKLNVKKKRKSRSKVNFVLHLGIISGIIAANLFVFSDGRINILESYPNRIVFFIITLLITGGILASINTPSSKTIAREKAVTTIIETTLEELYNRPGQSQQAEGK